MRWATASEAIATIRAGSAIVLGGGCGEPTTLTVAPAERASTNGGQSRVVAGSGEGVPTSIPGRLVDAVVTEHGVAHLRGPLNR